MRNMRDSVALMHMKNYYTDYLGKDLMNPNEHIHRFAGANKKWVLFLFLPQWNTTTCDTMRIFPCIEIKLFRFPNKTDEKNERETRE